MLSPKEPPQTSTPTAFAAALLADAARSGRPFTPDAQRMFMAALRCSDAWPADDAARGAQVRYANRLVVRAVQMATRDQSPEVTVRIIALAIADEQ